MVPHTGSMATTLHLLFSKPVALCPIAEYLLKWNQLNQFFYKEPMTPENGYFKPPEKPGLGVELDETKMTQRT